MLAQAIGGLIRGLITDGVKRLWTIAVPVAAALLVVSSWPTLDVESSAHDLIRVLGAPGHGVVDEATDWLRRPDIQGVIGALPSVVGILFALGGANRPAGGGSATALAWVVMVPLFAAEGRAAVGDVMLSWVLFSLVLLLFATINKWWGHEAEPAERRFFDPSDVRLMMVKSALQAFLVPLLPVIIALTAIRTSLSWPPLRLVMTTSRGDTEEVA